MQGCELYLYYILVITAVLLISLFFNFKQRKNIQKRIKKENILIKNAYYHPVTSLPNKENIKIVIADQIERTLRHNQSFLVALVKIKNYYEVELHSKSLAKEFMLEASERLLQSTRNEDIIGQISDDSFVIVFNEYLNDNNHNIVLKRIEESFVEPPELDTKYNIDFKISIGVAAYPEDGTDAEFLMEKARSAAIDID